MSDFLCWLDPLLILSELISTCAIMFWWNLPRYFIHVCHQHSSFEMLLSFPELHICLLSCRKKRLSIEVSTFSQISTGGWGDMNFYLLSKRCSLRFSAVVPIFFTFILLEIPILLFVEVYRMREKVINKCWRFLATWSKHISLVEGKQD